MIKFFISLLILPVSIFAHTLIFDTFDNEDGTMEITAMFSTGNSAEGAMVKIVSQASLEIIYEKRVDQSGIFVIDIPKEPYNLILDSGPGHVIEKAGTIKPQGGFTIVKEKKIDYAFYTTLILSLLFSILAVILYIEKIRREIKNENHK